MSGTFIQLLKREVGNLPELSSALVETCSAIYTQCPKSCSNVGDHCVVIKPSGLVLHRLV